MDDAEASPAVMYTACGGRTFPRCDAYEGSPDCRVGERLETDIAGAKLAGLPHRLRK